MEGRRPGTRAGPDWSAAFPSMSPFPSQDNLPTLKRSSPEAPAARRFSMLNTAAKLLPLLFALLWAVFPRAAQGAGSSVAATIDPDRGEVGQSLTYQVVVTGGGEVARPRLTALADFSVVEGGVQTQISVVNLRQTRSTVFTWYLFPKRAGTLTIPSLKLRVGGEILATRPLLVKADSASVNGESEAPLFARAAVEPATAYVGQALLYTVRLGTSLRASSPQWDIEDFGGLIQETSVKPEQSESTQVIGGRTYQIYDLRIPLFTLKAGSYTVPEAGARLDVAVESRSGRGSNPFSGDPFFRNSPFGMTGPTEARRLTLRPVKVEVKPLPPGAPPGFSGLVGRFSLSSRLSAEEIPLGESVTLTLKIEGQGNLSAARLELPPGEAFKVYEDQPVTQLYLEGTGLGGVTEFKKAVVPVQEGQMEIPSLTLSWFDPDARTYRKTTVGPWSLKVTPGAPGAAQTVRSPGLRVDQKKVEVLKDDILPIHTRAGGVSQWRWAPTDPPLLALLLLPPLMVGAVWGRKRMREEGKGGGTRRRVQAAQRARELLRQAAEKKGNAVYDDVSTAIRGFLGERLSLPGTALTAGEARDRVFQATADESLAQEVHRVLDRAEQGRYLGAAAVPSQVLCREAEELLSRLERVL